MDTGQVNELLGQAMETELGGEQIYLAAVEAAQNEQVREEWQKYLEETRNHQTVLREVFEAAGLDVGSESAGRAVIRDKAEALVNAINSARQTMPAGGAQIVAAECIVEAESKDHQNWVLIGLLAEHATGDLKKALQEAYDEVHEQEGEHLFHTMGWARELWLESLGVPAAIPPPEEEQHTKTQVGAGRAAKARDQYTD